MLNQELHPDDLADDFGNDNMENSVPGSLLKRAEQCRIDLIWRSKLKVDEEYLVQFRMHTEQIVFYREEGEEFIESFNF